MLTEQGFGIQRSKKVVEAVIEDAKVEQCEKVDTAIANYTHGQYEGAKDLDEEGVRQFRSLLGKDMCIAWDRHDLQYATTAASRGCASPGTRDLVKVKRIAS